jgi:hypothetical protein
MNTDNFVWTDELVSEYVQNIVFGNLGKEYNHILKFKESKQTKKEYEVLTVRIAYDKGTKLEETIHSVKRLSDGEVFTVGDAVKSYFGGGYLFGVIKSISNDGFINCINAREGGNDWCRPIIDTNDGFEISKARPIEDKQPTQTETIPINDVPCLSFNDVWSYLGKCRTGLTLKEDLIELVKTKLK